MYITFTTLTHYILTFFNSQTGLSGTNNKPTTNRIGTTPQTQLNCIQPDGEFAMAPTTYTIKIPIVKNSWKQVPSKPRIEVSANSEIYIGATTHEPPVEIPNQKKVFKTISVNTHSSHIYRLKNGLHTTK